MTEMNNDGCPGGLSSCGSSPAVSPVPASIPDAVWTPHTVAVWNRWTWGRWVAFKTTFYGEWMLSDDGGNTALFADESLQEVMARAQAIEARRAETTGAVHESAVRKDAPITPIEGTSHED